MDKINLKDILTGKLTKMPCSIDMDERFEFTQSLADALAAFQQAEFPEVGELYDADNVDAIRAASAWSAITDNFILFMMNEDNAFSTEVVIATFIRAIRIHEVTFRAETDAFVDFFREYSPWIVSGDYPTGALDESLRQKPQTEGYGGNFTLRDHHKAK